MVRLCGALLLIPLAASAEPQKLFDPPHHDDAPTAFACTAQTLASGEECVFEGKDAPRTSAKENVARFKSLAGDLCASALKGTSPGDAKTLDPTCRVRIEAAADRCASDAALVDGSGRFTSDARECYRALSDARIAAQSLANAAPNCCECLAAHHCGGAGASCVESAARANLTATCAVDACVEACAELVSSAPVASKTSSHKKGK